MLRLFNSRIASRIIFMAMGTFLLGCSGEPEATFVAFSQRMTLDRPGDQSLDSMAFKVAVGSMISAQETVIHYHQLLDYIAGKLGRKIKLIQRKTYGEINELIGSGQIDLAFIGSGPYVSGKEKYGFEALAIPQVRGTHLYRAYLIVNKESPFQKLADFRGKIFAFTDPESNTGKLVPSYWLWQQKEKPEDFFGKTIYTYGHDNSIMAVALSLVDGAAVHGQIWEYYNRRNPVFTTKTRIIKKSKLFGNPPVVASAQLSNHLHLKESIRMVLFNMQRDPEGKRILDELMIDRFIAPKEEFYHPILAMKRNL